MTIRRATPDIRTDDMAASRGTIVNVVSHR